MITTKLQVPLSTTLKQKADKIAKQQGFSSLQEIIRVFLTNYVEGKFTPMFVNTENIILSPKAEKKLQKLKDDFDKDSREGKTFFAKDGDDLLKQLKSMS